MPLVSGTLRLVEIAGGPVVLPDNPRVDASPAPVVVHVAGAAVYVVVGAFQFSRRVRRTQIGWHRRAGRVLVAAGLLVAGSGLWMTLFCELSTAVSVSAGWAVNAAIAEWLIRRRR